MLADDTLMLNKDLWIEGTFKVPYNSMQHLIRFLTKEEVECKM